MLDWNFYLFIRQGYYKDSKLKAIIKFDKLNSKKIIEASFLTPTYHTLVDFNTGEIDLFRLGIQK